MNLDIIEEASYPNAGILGRRDYWRSSSKVVVVSPSRKPSPVRAFKEVRISDRLVGKPRIVWGEKTSELGFKVGETRESGSPRHSDFEKINRDEIARIVRDLSVRVDLIFCERKLSEITSAKPVYNVFVSDKSQFEFTPSSKLVSIIQDGITKFVEERPEVLQSAIFVEFNRSLTPALWSKLLGQRLRALLATLAFRQADGLEPRLPVTSNGEFNSVIQSALLEVLPLWPSDLPVFQSTLRQELKLYLRQGLYNGGWGHLEVHNGELRFMFAKENISKIGGSGTRARQLDL